MKYKLLQLNIEMGRRLDELLEHININNYDILHFQELAGKERAPNSVDTFDYLQSKLPDYKGTLSKMFNVVNQPDNYLGTATFIKKGIEVTGHEVIWMTDSWEISEDNDDPVDRPYPAQVTKIKLGGSELLLVNGHFTWGPRPYDTDLTISRSRKVYDYLKSQKKEFILTGDFNVDSRTITVMQFEELGTNLTREHKITNTLNPRLHRLKKLFPEGIPCDQAIVSPGVKVVEFALVVEDLSDHFGLLLELSI